MSSASAHQALDRLPSWQAAPNATGGHFNGADHGSPVSAFVVDAGAGEGPSLHWHPYTETFIVLAGRARFQRGDDEIDARAGDLVVVPALTLHRFESLGPAPLRLVAIHDAPRLHSVFVD